MSSKPIVVQLTLSKTGFSQGITSAQRQMRQLQASAQEMGHGTVSSMQASSAAIRVLEGGITGNIRAAERFIGILPGVGAALKAAFPLIGGIALAGVFIKIGEEAANFVKKMNEIPPNPFGGLISSAKLSNDQLAISNDRLAMEIAKLEHKPVNGMALALDQARESSDKLFQSLMKANEAFTEAMGKSNIGTFKGLWNNMASTDAANKDIANARSGVQAITAGHQPVIDDALASGNQKNIAQARESLMVDLQKAYAQQDAQLRAGLTAAQAKQADFKGSYRVGSDQSKVIEKYQAAIAQSANEQSDVGGNYGQSVMQPKKDALDAANTNAEAARKAQEALIQGWHKAFDEAKADYDMTLAQEAQFWNQRLQETRKGSLSYIAALDETNKVIAQMRAQNMRDRATFDKTSSIGSDSMDLSRGATSELQNEGRESAEYLKSLNQGIELQRANADAIAEASLQMELMTGRISRLDAARVQATMHEQQYRDAIESVQSALAAAANLPGGAFKDKTISDMNNRQGQIETNHTIQAAQDQQAVSGQQIVPAMLDGIREMVQGFLDMTSTLKTVIPRTMDGLNEDMARLFTGQGKKGDFAKTLAESGQGLMKSALQGLEGKALGALGLGPKAHPGSSPLNPLYTVNVGGGAGAGVGAGTSASLGSILGKLPGVGQFIQPFSALLPHFAAGGEAYANHPLILGERGAEMFVPHTAGRIIPNHQLGSGGDTHFHVDARGSNDPMAVESAVRRGVHASVAGSIQANHQAKMRSPGGR